MNALTFDWDTITDKSPVDFRNGIVVDNFAGGGGASTGIARALGRVDVAVNHDPAAIAVHKANHPETRHLCQSVYRADPLDVTGGRPLLLGWFSPDCKHFSKAKGGKPVAKNIRDLAWVVVHYARRIGAKNLKVFMLENVEEFQDWGPLVETDKGWMPDKQRKGEDFQKWCKALRKAGATAIEWKELRACDYGVPTIRKRLFVMIRFDGEPIVWPEPTHGAPDSEEVRSGRLKPWKTAADCIDWSIPCPSIFERLKPLKEATCRRIAAGIVRYVLNSAKPFIVPLTHQGAIRVGDLDAPMVTVTGANRGELALATPYIVPVTHTSNGGSGRSASDPLATITTAKGGEQALVVPHITKFRNGSVGHRIDEPLHTVTANSFIKRPGGSQPLAYVEATIERAEAVAAFLAQHNTGVIGRAADAPLSTIMHTGSHQQIVTSNLVKLRGTCADGQPTDEPMPTLTAGGTHVGEVRAFLAKYYGDEHNGQALGDPLHTVTTKDRFGLVTLSIAGEEYVIVDIGMRMLERHELGAAQGFPANYNFAPVCEYVTESGATKFGPLPKSQGIAKIGNSVCPDLPEALIRANLPEYCVPRLPDHEVAA